MRILNEDTFIDSVLDDMNLNKAQEKELKKDIQQADAQLGDDTLIVDAVNGDDGDIEQALNGALQANLEQLEYGGKNFTNILFLAFLKYHSYSISIWPISIAWYPNLYKS